MVRKSFLCVRNGTAQEPERSRMPTLRQALRERRLEATHAPRQVQSVLDGESAEMATSEVQALRQELS